MSNRVEDLRPEVQEMALQFLQECARRGLLLRITSTLRTFDEQRSLYAQGRTAPGPVVTAAPPGYSYHNFGLAFDVCQIGHDPFPESEGFWDRLGDIGESLGLAWGGRWKHPDRPHFEWHGAGTLADLRVKAKEDGLLA